MKQLNDRKNKNADDQTFGWDKSIFLKNVQNKMLSSTLPIKNTLSQELGGEFIFKNEIQALKKCLFIQALNKKSWLDHPCK